MTDEKLLRAIGDIDDRFVEEADAAPAAARKDVAWAEQAPVKAEKRTPRNRRRPLKIAAGACAAVLIFTAGFFGGSGALGRKNNSYSPDANRVPNDPIDYEGVPSEQKYSDGTIRNYGGWTFAEVPGEDVNASPSGDGSDVNLPEGPESYEAGGLHYAKIIYTASMSLQSTEFEETCAFIKSLAERYLAYIESETVDNGSSSYRSASYVVRVTSENYSDFLTGMSEGCTVVSLNQKLTDVADQYYDIEQKIQTLRTKHDRLLELLSTADNMSDIIVIENELSETEYEINQYQGSLNKYDSLINYSTVKISLKEVERADASIGDRPGFFQKLGQSFTSGLSNTGSALETLVYWISYNIVAIMILAAIVIAVVKIHPIKRIKAARAGKED